MWCCLPAPDPYARVPLVRSHMFLKSAGLATVVLTPMKEVAERMQVPRALHTRFPVGLSLGKPKDPEFQQQVLQAAFDLLRASSGPVLQTFVRDDRCDGQ